MKLSSVAGCGGDVLVCVCVCVWAADVVPCPQYCEAPIGGGGGAFCELKVRRDQVEAHVANECLMTRQPCPVPGCEDMVARGDADGHQRDPKHIPMLVSAVQALQASTAGVEGRRGGARRAAASRGGSSGTRGSCGTVLSWCAANPGRAGMSEVMPTSTESTSKPTGGCVSIWTALLLGSIPVTEPRISRALAACARRTRSMSS